MSLAFIVVSLVKILIMFMFFLNMAALGIWADRRQSAMVQDRVGPNRAVVYLPSGVVRLIVLLPPAVLGAFAALPAMPFRRDLMQPTANEVLVLAAQAAVFFTWFGLVVLSGTVRRSGEAVNKFEETIGGIAPRSIFFAGLGLHVLAFGITSAISDAAAPKAARVACALLALVLFATAIYTASRVPEGKVAIRLAGTLHSLADALKLVWKEDFVPKNADKLLHALAPMLALFPALVTYAVIPFGMPLCVGGNPSQPLDFKDFGHVAPAMSRDFVCRGHAIPLQIADLNVGILYLFAMAGTGIIGAALAGWASDNKFSLLGGLRAASQMVSYEVAMGLSLIGIFIIYGSVRLGPMVEWQGANAWGIFVQPFAFFLFLAALCAETKRVPFDQPEGESEIVAGYFVEYSGMKFGMFFMGEYIELFTSSALLVTLFFGGYQLPFLHADGVTIAFGDTLLWQYKMNHVAVVLISALAFFGKVVLMAWVQVFFRWTLPRFRYDQLMKLGWTKLLPAALANLTVTGMIVLAIDAAPPGVARTLRVLADLSQALIAVGAVVGIAVIVLGLFAPVERKKFLVKSTAARFAAAAGGTRASTQQA